MIRLVVLIFTLLSAPTIFFAEENKKTFFRPGINIEEVTLTKNYNYKKRTRMQDTKLDEFIENGAFYVFSSAGFKKNKNRLYGKITYIEMPKESVFEVDDKEDLKIIKKLLR